MSKSSKKPQSGKRGTTVSFKSRFGQAERELAVPANPRTNAQIRSRTALGRSSSRWRRLSDEQRALWSRAARGVRSKARLGQSGSLTGCQFYNKINCTLDAVGEAPTDTPTDRPAFGVSPVGLLDITTNGGDVALTLSVARTPAQSILVLGTAPCSAGRSVPRRFVILGLLPAPVSGVCNITGLYVARYGVPPAGSRVFIRTVQVANGWQDFPKDTTAVVPPE